MLCAVTCHIRYIPREHQAGGTIGFQHIFIHRWKNSLQPTLCRCITSRRIVKPNYRMYKHTVDTIKILHNGSHLRQEKDSNNSFQSVKTIHHHHESTKTGIHEQLQVQLSLPLFPFVRGEVLSATSSPPHLVVFSTLLCLLAYSSSLPPLLPSSHLTEHCPPISALASPVSSCPAHLTLTLSSVLCHPPSFLRVLPIVVCSSPVSLSSSSALPSHPLTPPSFSCRLSLLLLFFVPSYFRTRAAFVVVVRSKPRFQFRTGMLV